MAAFPVACVCMMRMLKYVCAEGDDDGVQGFVLFEGCVVHGKLEGGTV